MGLYKVKRSCASHLKWKKSGGTELIVVYLGSVPNENNLRYIVRFGYNTCTPHRFAHPIPLFHTFAMLSNSNSLRSFNSRSELELKELCWAWLSECYLFTLCFSRLLHFFDLEPRVHCKWQKGLCIFFYTFGLLQKFVHLYYLCTEGAMLAKLNDKEGV